MCGHNYWKHRNHNWFIYKNEFNDNITREMQMHFGIKPFWTRKPNLMKWTKQKIDIITLRVSVVGTRLNAKFKTYTYIIML